MPSIRLNLTVNDDGSVTLKKFRKNARRSFKGAEQDAKSFGVAGKAAMLAVAYGAFRLAKSFGGLIKDSAMMAARFETMGVVMRVVGKNAGYSQAQMLAFSKGLQKTGISMIESREALVKLTQAQLDLNKSSELARIAQDAAVIGNINSSEAFGRLVHGIQAASVITLRTIGINVTFEEGYKKLAAQLGKNQDQLTANEKAQSRMNQVLEYGRRIAGTYEGAMSTAGKQITSFKRYVDDFKVKMGEAFGPATAQIVKRMTELMKEWTSQITTPEAQEKLKQMANDIAALVEHLADLAKLLPSVISGLKTLFDLNPWKLIPGMVKRSRAQREFLMQAQEKMGQKVPSPEMSFDLAGADQSFLAAIQKEYGFVPKTLEATKKKRAVSPSTQPQKPTTTPASISEDDLKMVEAQFKQWEKLDDLYKEVSMASLPEVERAAAQVKDEYARLDEGIKTLVASGEYSTEELKNFSESLSKRMQEDLDELAKKADETFSGEMKNAITGWASNFSATIADAILFAEDGFKELGKSFLRMVTQMLVQKQLVEPFLMSFGLTASADGNVFSGGRVQAFAGGGIVSRPTLFPMANGAGLMGEAGPEAIMPLQRDSSGKLGVSGGGGNQTIIINAVDSKSFHDAIKRNAGSVISVIGDAVAAGDMGLKASLRAGVK